MQEFWALAIDFGRLPDADEIPGDLSACLRAARASPSRAADMCLARFDRDALDAAGRVRKEDLLVHFALSLFPGAPRYMTLPRSIQHDVKAFLGSHTATLAEAKTLLFSAGRPEAVWAGVETALEAGLGGMRDDRTLRFHVLSLNRLPAVLHVLVGCAGVLRGGVEAADFVDVKLDGPRLSIITCDDAAKLLPVIVWWMPCLAADRAVVSSPRNAFSATSALNSAEYRFRLPVIRVRPPQGGPSLTTCPNFGDHLTGRRSPRPAWSHS